MNNKARKCSQCDEPAINTSRCFLHYREYFCEYRKNNLERIRETARESRKRIYHKDWKERWRTYVNSRVNRKIKNGKIIPEPCHCGADAQAHHDSYLAKDIYRVRWLCRIHHAEWHRNNEYVFPTRIQYNRYKKRRLKKVDNSS